MNKDVVLKNSGMLFGAQIMKKRHICCLWLLCSTWRKFLLDIQVAVLKHYKTAIIAHSSRKISMVRHAKTHQSPPYTTTKFSFSTLQHLSFLEVVKLLSICCDWRTTASGFAEKNLRQHHRNIQQKTKLFIKATKYGYSTSLNFLSFSVL